MAARKDRSKSPWQFPLVIALTSPVDPIRPHVIGCLRWERFEGIIKRNHFGPVNSHVSTVFHNSPQAEFQSEGREMRLCRYEVFCFCPDWWITAVDTRTTTGHHTDKGLVRLTVGGI